MTLRPLTGDLLDKLRAELSESAVREVAPAYLAEPRGLFAGRAGAVVAPRDTGEVATTVRFAGQHRIGIVPWGGGTGLVGGQVMPDGPTPLVLSLERMRAVRGLWPEENVMTVEAGAILVDVQTAAAEAQRLFPLSLASEGSARIGGLLSTNAGGVNVLRYGNARDLCLGIEAVMPDGSVLHGLKRLRKDNTGYDLRSLLIGAEGTLGIITAAALRLFPRPARGGTAILSVASPAAAIALLGVAQESGGVSAFELISGQGLAFLRETGLTVRNLFESDPDWCVLVDLGLARDGDPDAALEALFETGAEEGWVDDGVIARSEAQRADLWAVRENLSEANKRVGAVLSNDISLPISEIPGFMVAATDAIARQGPFRINAFGHLGDGNLHFNLFPPVGEARADHLHRADDLRRIIDDLVAERGGSFSAEHGIGRLKVGELERYGDPAKLVAMRAIKTALDPKGIMNPGAVLRPQA